MCTRQHHFKFCTCAPDLKQEDADWQLSSVDHSVILFGQSYGTYHWEEPAGRKMMEANLLHDLNTHACFDFPYEPKEEDYLRLETKQFHTFHFYHDDHRWVAEEKERHPVAYLKDVKSGCLVHPQPGRPEQGTF